MEEEDEAMQMRLCGWLSCHDVHTEICCRESSSEDPAEKNCRSDGSDTQMKWCLLLIVVFPLKHKDIKTICQEAREPTQHTLSVMSSVSPGADFFLPLIVFHCSYCANRDDSSEFEKHTSSSLHSHEKHSCGRVPLAVFVLLSVVPLSALSKANPFLSVANTLTSAYRCPRQTNAPHLQRITAATKLCFQRLQPFHTQRQAKKKVWIHLSHTDPLCGSMLDPAEINLWLPPPRAYGH